MRSTLSKIIIATGLICFHRVNAQISYDIRPPTFTAAKLILDFEYGAEHPHQIQFLTKVTDNSMCRTSDETIVEAIRYDLIRHDCAIPELNGTRLSTTSEMGMYINHTVFKEKKDYETNSDFQIENIAEQDLANFYVPNCQYKALAYSTFERIFDTASSWEREILVISVPSSEVEVDLTVNQK